MRIHTVPLPVTPAASRFNPGAFIRVAFLMSCLTANSALAASAGSDRFEKVLAAPQNGTVFLNVSAGTVEVNSWTGSNVYLIASKPAGASRAPLSSLLSIMAAGNSIRVANTSAAEGLKVSLYVPEGYRLDIQSEAASVHVTGNVGDANIRTQTASVVLTLDTEPGASLDAKTTSGRVESRVPVRVSANATTGRLVGTIGRGGRSIEITSNSGNILLLPGNLAELLKQSQPARAPGRAADSGSGFRSSDKGIAQPPSPLGSNDGVIDAPARPGRARRPPVLNTGDSPAGSSSVPRDDDSNSDVVKLESRLITLNVKVSDRDGRAVSTLKPDDFLVYEDGVQQEIQFFDPVTAPIDLVLLLDLSGSIREKRDVLKRAATRFVNTLSSADRVAVMTFTRSFQVVSGFTADRALLRRRIEDINAGEGGTSFYDAMWQTVDFLKSESSLRRRAVVVLTDGVDSSLDDFRDYRPEHPFTEMLMRAQEADATIYPIYLDTEKDVVEHHGQSSHAAYVTARAQLRQLADSTGGTLFFSARIEDLESVYGRVVAELHTLYSVSYSPSNSEFDGGYRKVRVRMAQPELVARTRPGYYAK